MPSANSSVAVVTGAARGFGREIAGRLVARGHHVLITDLDAAEVESAAAELGCTGRVADAREPKAHDEVAAAAAELGTVRVWVNNAGVLRVGSAWEQSDADIDLTVDVNLRGVLYGSRAAVNAMREHGGHLLNIASISAHGPVPGMAVYAATKAAVLSYTTSLQGDLDLAKVPVRVHALCPDAADTNLVRSEQHLPDSALLFSGRQLLAPAAVADAALALLDGNRMVRSMPVHRAAALRFGNLLPQVGLRILGLLRSQGERRRSAGG